MNKKFYKMLFAMLLLSAMMFAFSACSVNISKPNENKTLDLSNMNLVFEDDFNGELNKDIWQTDFETPVRRGGFGLMNSALRKTEI